MTNDEIENLTRSGSLASFIGAAIAALGTFVAYSDTHPFSSTVPGLVDALAMAVLGYGLRKKSRVCGVLLSVFIVAGSLTRMILTRGFGMSFVNIVILAFVIGGTIGAFKWHRLHAGA
jgi:hypothetical membrane protein